MNGRGFNWQIWAGLILSLGGYSSWNLFLKWPITRDVPWANLLLFGLAAWMLVVGVRRAFDADSVHPLKVMATGGVVVFSLASCALFLLVRFVWAVGLPASTAAPQVGTRAPEFSLLDEHQRPWSLATLLTAPLPGSATASAPKGVLLVFYMYSGCRACNSEFRGLQQNLATLAEAGLRPVAISIDPPDISRRLSEEAGYTFTFLSDPKMEVIRLYDLASPGEGARPAEFLVDATGVVRWRHLTTNHWVRATPGQILDAARTLR
jgi:peroxiredoxin